jgi:hypothetical protein
MRAAQDVLGERERQRAKWGEAHDDEHADGALGAAGALLAWPDGYWFYDEKDADKCCIPAPGFAYELLKKHEHDRRKQLVIAAAFLLAEIERLDRASPVCPECRGKGTTPDVDPAYQCRCDTCGGTGVRPS